MSRLSFRAAAVGLSVALAASGAVAVGSASASMKGHHHHHHHHHAKKKLHGKPDMIASIVGTTGAYGTTGQSIDDGAKVAVKFLNSKGGLLGHPVQLKTYNDNASATLASEEFKRAVSAGAIAINGSSDTGPATAAEADRYKIPDVGIVDDGGPTIYPNGFGTTPLPWVYEFSPDNFAIGEKFAAYALKHCPGGLALLHDSTTYGVGASEAESAAYKKAGKALKVDDTITENWSTGATVGLTSEIDKIKSSGADCVDVWLTPQDQAAFQQQVHSLGDHFTIFGNDESYATPTYTKLAGTLANGTLSAMLTAQLHPTKQMKKFTRLYKHMWHQEPGIYAAATWDAILMVAKAVEMKHSTKNTAIQTAMNHIHGFHGATGKLGFTKKNHQTVGPKQLTLVRYDASKSTWVPVG